MNCDTGRFENFNSGDDIKPPWREWSVDELIVVKDENTKKLVMSRLLVGNRSGGVLVHKNQIDILSAGRIKAMQGRRHRRLILIFMLMNRLYVLIQRVCLICMRWLLIGRLSRLLYFWGYRYG
ncbi:MAG: hypothetical protein HOI47_21610 [Candidatus Scalindua sp.]|jgi:hypothetical protein|nr:hypothetical protein [Candidatus Scalindua sp.]